MFMLHGTRWMTQSIAQGSILLVHYCARSYIVMKLQRSHNSSICLGRLVCMLQLAKYEDTFVIIHGDALTCRSQRVPAGNQQKTRTVTSSCQHAKEKKTVEPSQVHGTTAVSKACRPGRKKDQQTNVLSSEIKNSKCNTPFTFKAQHLVRPLYSHPSHPKSPPPHNNTKPTAVHTTIQTTCPPPNQNFRLTLRPLDHPSFPCNHQVPNTISMGTEFPCSQVTQAIYNIVQTSPPMRTPRSRTLAPRP